MNTGRGFKSEEMVLRADYPAVNVRRSVVFASSRHGETAIDTALNTHACLGAGELRRNWLAL